jgi:hypothetical protein
VGKKNKGKKGKPLTGLAAALVKSGHLSEKKAKSLGRDQRREDKALGKDGIAQREAQKQATDEAARVAQASADRERAASKTSDEAHERLRRVVRDGMAHGAGGSRRWFFVARDGRILFMELADDVAGMLVSGSAGIVESLGEARDAHVVVAPERALTTLVGIDPEVVRFWNREGPPPRRPE